jgi:ABC-type phosphate/phosphonate transport system substrate-binding protein
MKNKLIAITALLFVTSLLSSCANSPSTATDERKFDRKKSAMYVR